MKHFNANRFILDALNWDMCFSRAAELESNQDKGELFDRLTQLYLQVAPKYQSKLKNVWLLKDVPIRIRKDLNLPEPDRGIDQIAETFDGEFWAIQSKFRSVTDGALTYKELSTFSTLAFVHCRNIKLGIVSHTSTLPIRRRSLLGNVVELGFDHWFRIDDELWQQIRAKARGRPKKFKPRKMRPHQRKAITATKAHFS